MSGECVGLRVSASDDQLATQHDLLRWGSASEVSSSTMTVHAHEDACGVLIGGRALGQTDTRDDAGRMKRVR